MEEQKIETPVKKSSQKNLIWILLGVAILIVGTAVGYGFYTGARVSSYAKEVKAIMEDSNSQWTMQKLEDKNSDDLEAIRSDAELVKKDSQKQLAKLKKLNALRGTRNLSTKINDYFVIAKNMGTNILEFLDYLTILEGTQESFKSLGVSSSGTEGYIQVFEEIHQSFADSISKLEKADPPASYKEFNEEYLAALKKFDVLIVEALGYAKNNQFDKIDSMTPRFNEVSQEFSQISPPNSTKSLEEIATAEDKTKLREYPEQIKKIADDLMKVKFSF